MTLLSSASSGMTSGFFWALSSMASVPPSGQTHSRWWCTCRGDLATSRRDTLHLTPVGGAALHFCPVAEDHQWPHTCSSLAGSGSWSVLVPASLCSQVMPDPRHGEMQAPTWAGQRSMLLMFFHSSGTHLGGKALHARLAVADCPLLHVCVIRLGDMSACPLTIEAPTCSHSTADSGVVRRLDTVPRHPALPAGLSYLGESAEGRELSSGIPQLSRLAGITARKRSQKYHS